MNITGMPQTYNASLNFVGDDTLGRKLIERALTLFSTGQYRSRYYAMLAAKDELEREETKRMLRILAAADEAAKAVQQSPP